MKDNPTPGTWVLLASGIVVLIGSFLPFLTGGGESVSAWNGDFVTLFPVSIIPVLLGVVVALHLALTTFASVQLPDRVLGIGWPQLYLVFGGHAALMMLAYLILDRPFGASLGAGFWLMFLAAAGLVVGAVLRQKELSAA